MTMNPEFDGSSLVAGTIRGVRVFRAMIDGRMRGAVAPLPFEPDEKGWAQGRHFAGMGMGPTLPNHKVAGMNCTCGFYAYFSEQTNNYAESDGSTITAIVEGSGTVTAGSLGFRAERLRVLALIAPNMPKRRRLRDIFNDPLLVALAAMACVAGAAFTEGEKAAGSMISAVAALLLMLVVGMELSNGQTGRSLKGYVLITPQVFDRLRALYPQVPVFSSLEDALMVFPLDQGEDVA